MFLRLVLVTLPRKYSGPSERNILRQSEDIAVETILLRTDRLIGQFLRNRIKIFIHTVGDMFNTI